MKKAWKWILGILVVLVVVAALVAVPLVMHNYMAVRFSTASSAQANGAAPQANGNGWNAGPMMRGYEGGGRESWQHPQFDGRRSFMRGGDRHSRFGFGLMFIGGLLRLIPLALFDLLLYGVYQLGKRAGVRSSLAPAPIAAAPAVASEEKPAA